MAETATFLWAQDRHEKGIPIGCYNKGKKEKSLHTTFKQQNGGEETSMNSTDFQVGFINL